MDHLGYRDGFFYNFSKDLMQDIDILKYFFQKKVKIDYPRHKHGLKYYFQGLIIWIFKKIFPETIQDINMDF